MKETVLVTGGARSGKSSYVLELAAPYSRKAFIATAEAFDDEMQDRIVKHQAERGRDFVTVEEPVDLADALRSLPDDIDVAVVDCLTVWLGNLMYHRKVEHVDAPEITDLLAVLENPPCSVLLVTNEVGMGIVPDNALARAYRDLAGSLNQRVAAVVDRVVFMACGCPLQMKGPKT